MSINYDDRIPNNVNLSGDARLKRALETWLPHYQEWWKSVGPQVFPTNEIYLRTAISTEAGGWANFGYVRMPEYRWGIFLAAKEEGRTIPGGDHVGEPVWDSVPGEYRNTLKRLIVTQADTEPASVEQQRFLANTAPSLYDARNLFQVNVEEGRHLWAMVYLLHAHFGRDGRDEADELLARRAGDADKPRILEAFNQPCEDWLTFHCFTCFTDRDGKFQLGALAESGFDPLSRTCRFMLTEEAHHLFVGESGMERIIRRAAQLMKTDKNEDVRAQGGIDLDTIQRYVNYWYCYSLDLFGGEVSTNAADFFAQGLKGRWHEAKDYEEHTALGATRVVKHVENGALVDKEVPLRNAMNEELRDSYIKDCERVVKKWNTALGEEGITGFEIKLPSSRFFRRQGIYTDAQFDPSGRLISDDEFAKHAATWLPTDADRAYVKSLMKPVYEPGKIAQYMAPPKRTAVDGKPFEFEFVRVD